MTSINPLRALAAATLAGGLLAASAAIGSPAATIHFSGGSVAFIGQVNWGGGDLNYRGRHVPLKVSGIGVGAIGADRFDAVGEVYNLHRIEDIEGTYAAVNASATAGLGAGWIDMSNEHGVEIRAHSSSAGLKLSLAPSGMGIQIK
jgi:hypothetical protein